MCPVLACYSGIKGKNENSPSNVFSGAVATALNCQSSFLCIGFQLLSMNFIFIGLLNRDTDKGASIKNVRKLCAFNDPVFAKFDLLLAIIIHVLDSLSHVHQTFVWMIAKLNSCSRHHDRRSYQKVKRLRRINNR